MVCWGGGGAVGEGLQAVCSCRGGPREEEKPRLFRKLPKGLGKPGVFPFAQDELGEEQKPRPPLPGLLGQGAEGLEELP